MAMATATAAQGVLGLAGGATKFFEGRKMQREAQKKIDAFEWNDLENAYKNQQVSTLGSDLLREENARATATTTDALRGGGNRAIVGGLGKVVAQSNTVNREAAANLDQQQKQIDFAKAQDDVRIREMIEKRQSDELQGYGQMLNTGMGMRYSGIGDAINAVGVVGQGLGMFGAATTPLVQGAATGGLPVTNPQNYNSSFKAPNYSAGFGTSGMGYWGDNFLNNFSQNFSNFKNRPH